MIAVEVMIVKTDGISDGNSDRNSNRIVTGRVMILMALMVTLVTERW